MLYKNISLAKIKNMLILLNVKQNYIHYIQIIIRIIVWKKFKKLIIEPIRICYLAKQKRVVP